MAEIVVIGAGMGSLAAAARLAVAGHRVAVYERGGTYGGALRRFEKDGFVFDTGPGLLPLPAVWRDLFVKTGKAALEDRVELRQVDPDVRHVFEDGSELTLPAASRAGVIRALDEALGAGSGERWTALVSRARAAWDATRRPLLEEPRTVDGPHQPLPDPYPARRRGLLRRRTPTLAEIARDELRDPRLERMLCSAVRLHGLDPRTAPAAASVLVYLEQTFGSWYPVGGMRALADSVHERCLERRVEFHYGAEAARVVVEDGRAVGVEFTDGTTVNADAVVDGTGRLAPQDNGSAPDADHSPAGAAARHTLLLALRGPRPADTVHRTVVHGDEPVCVLRPDDPSLVPSPDEHEAVVVSTVVPAGAVPGEEGVRRLLSAAERAVPDLEDRLLWHVSRTPADNEAETGARGGAVPPPALAGRPLPTANLGRTQGCYAVGGWAHPGGGLPHAGMSGAMAAGLLVEGAEWRGSR
ncbi:phytoene desaturase family protein [Streptomyces alkaliterrae]|uniref:NAD(P)-binding protein n=1 Tax=Streptomyces alkaliterrae TaxID=2213162 RepID=A0A5P0YYD6_9ACTN|nr:NAD(P)/FAD-dependent oxidoreductase [Streptomyces alkaliterrae]MBB1259337.1 NAD(P)/FAD-dependent oxidoreductase [Streptomyces alkaliterrae]MQS03449.1 NAD(P)-binding protein [Streptomyces alkaliterrae]